MSSSSPPDDATTSPRRGPRGERGEIQDRILAAARESFAEHGYAGTSMRSVARTADVDAALVSYYFTNKAGLLDAALMTPPEFGDRIARAAAAPISRRGRALVQAMIDAWEDPTESVFLRSIILTAAHEPIAMDRLRDTFALVILDAVSAELPPEERGVRAALIASQVVGVVMTRYVWQIGPMAEMGVDDVVTLVAPTVQRYLTRPLPTGSTDKEP